MVKENSFDLRAGQTIDLAASIEKSNFRNRPEIRLRIVDIKAKNIIYALEKTVAAARKYIYGKIVIYTDGGSRGNPGPAGAGVAIADGKGKYYKRILSFFGCKNQ